MLLHYEIRVLQLVSQMVSFHFWNFLCMRIILITLRKGLGLRSMLNGELLASLNSVRIYNHESTIINQDNPGCAGLQIG